MKEDQSTSRTWYNVQSGGGLVTADQIDHSVEGIYRRSHCWTSATEWRQAQDGVAQPMQQDQAAGLEPQPRNPHAAASPYLSPQQSPYASPHASPLMRPLSPAHSDTRSVSHDRTSLNLGLEAMGTSPSQQVPRPASTFNPPIKFEADPNMTFDAILGPSDEPKPKGKKGKK